MTAQNNPNSDSQAKTNSSDYGLRIFSSLRQIIRSADVDSRRLAADHEITGPQLLCLIAVAEGNATMTSRELADTIYISPSTIVGILDRLEEKGLVERARSSTDRRVVHIHATDKGRELAKVVPYPLHDALSDALAQMSNADQKRLTENLERLTELIGVNTQADQDGQP
jgi:DNA-binding MarR family transcriptional regulator